MAQAIRSNAACQNVSNSYGKPRGLSSRTLRATSGLKELDLNDRRRSRSEGNPPARSSSCSGARCDRQGCGSTANPLVTRRQKLRGFMDADHLKNELYSNQLLIDHGLPPLTFIAADDNLLAAAQSEGLTTENPNDDP